MEKLHHLFTLKMNKADSICLITDIWTSRSNSDFIALAAVLCHGNSKELIIIGLDRMKGPHCAENIQLSIEDMINKYQIDKSKIVGKAAQKISFKKKKN